MFSSLVTKFRHLGNRRLRVTVSIFLKQYIKARDDRSRKGSVIQNVLNIIYGNSPVGAFVRFHHGRYWEVDKRTAREKVGALFRDFLGDRYRSSSKSRVVRKRQKRLSASPAVSQTGSVATVPAASTVSVATSVPDNKCSPYSDK